MASTLLEGEGGLSSFVASTSLEGEEGLSWSKPAYLHWVSTLKERPAECKVISSSACLNTWDKIALWCLRPRRGLVQQHRIILGVSKHQGDLALISAHLVPTPEERPTRRQRRFVPGVSKNTKANKCSWCPRPRRGMLKAVSYRPGVSKHQDDQGLW